MEKEISVLEDNVYKTYFDENAKHEVFVLEMDNAKKHGIAELAKTQIRILNCRHHIGYFHRILKLFTIGYLILARGNIIK